MTLIFHELCICLKTLDTFLGNNVRYLDKDYEYLILCQKSLIEVNKQISIKIKSSHKFNLFLIDDCIILDEHKNIYLQLIKDLSRLFYINNEIIVNKSNIIEFMMKHNLFPLYFTYKDNNQNNNDVFNQFSIMQNFELYLSLFITFSQTFISGSIFVSDLQLFTILKNNFIYEFNISNVVIRFRKKNVIANYLL